ncbi:MAG: hypothetical protein LUE14_09250 [Clostridiales bacterium]|nr:hypothetical protein [Clostridiales bacterium]
MRTYRIHGTEHEVNEERFGYNSTTELNSKATLKEVKEKVGSSKGFDKSPGTVYLRSCGNLVAAATTAGCRMEVYDNGFAIYQRPDTAAVLRMEYVGKCWYEGDPELERGNQNIDLSDMAWVVAVMMKGEERLEKWQGERDAERLVSLCVAGETDEETGEKTELDVAASVNIELEIEEREEREAFVKELTQRQCECAQMYYGLGMTQQEIGDVIGLAQRSVSHHLEGALIKARKYLKKAEKNF